ncbi:MAG: hypothetical protein GX456_13120 [Verrucomicrobia bacterium]|nr:hypothetical protein [Verrucomicrobiota bacterium]
MAPFDLADNPDGFYRSAADAVGGGRREAFGVRQLAAALFSCPNNVSVPISASGGASEIAVLAAVAGQAQAQPKQLTLIYRAFRQ